MRWETESQAQCLTPRPELPLAGIVGSGMEKEAGGSEKPQELSSICIAGRRTQEPSTDSQVRQGTLVPSAGIHLSLSPWRLLSPSPHQAASPATTQVEVL